MNEKDRMIEVLMEHNNDLRSIHHSFRTRLDAIELYVRKRAKESYRSGREENQLELDLFAAIGGLEDLSSEFEKLSKEKAPKRLLQKTGVAMLDIIFEYFQDICIKKDVELTLNAWGNVRNMVIEAVSSENLQTLVVNLLHNAIDAIDAADAGTMHRLVVNIGHAGSHYMLSVWDTGKAFDAQILEKLGKERITSKKSSEGGGIGFEEIFNILQSHKASLNIDNTAGAGFTKIVSIFFNGLGQHTIM